MASHFQCDGHGLLEMTQDLTSYYWIRLSPLASEQDQDSNPLLHTGVFLSDHPSMYF